MTNRWTREHGDIIAKDDKEVLATSNYESKYKEIDELLRAANSSEAVRDALKGLVRHYGYYGDTEWQEKLQTARELLTATEAEA